MPYFDEYDEDELETIPFTAAEKHAKAKAFAKLTEVMGEICNEMAGMEQALKEIKTQYTRKLKALDGKLDRAKDNIRKWMRSVVEEHIELESTSLEPLEREIEDPESGGFHPESFLDEWGLDDNLLEDVATEVGSAREYMQALTEAMDAVQDGVVVPKSDEDDEG